jgi:hypothetical protein
MIRIELSSIPQRGSSINYLNEDGKTSSKLSRNHVVNGYMFTLIFDTRPFFIDELVQVS